MIYIGSFRTDVNIINELYFGGGGNLTQPKNVKKRNKYLQATPNLGTTSAS